MNRMTVMALLLATNAAQADELPSYELVARDGRFVPEVVHVNAGQRCKLVVRNAGTEPVEFESVELRKEKVLGPGATSFVVVAPLKAGSYRFFDDFHPRTGQGRLVAE